MFKVGSIPKVRLELMTLRLKVRHMLYRLNQPGTPVPQLLIDNSD